MDAVALLGGILVAVIVLWTLFLAYCAIMASRRSGKFQLTPWPVRALSYTLLGLLVVGDIALNFTLGSAIFLELPNLHRPTFTQRCADHLDDQDWRGDRARWFCYGWLNPFQEHHCR